MQSSYVMMLFGIVIAIIMGVTYYIYTSSQSLNSRIDNCDQEINQLKVKLQNVESIFAKPHVEDLSPMFSLSQNSKPFDIIPEWTKVESPEKVPLISDITNTPEIKKDPWLSSSEENSRPCSQSSNSGEK